MNNFLKLFTYFVRVMQCFRLIYVPRFFRILKQLPHLSPKRVVPSYNDFHSILRHFDVLPNLTFTTNEMKRDYS